MKKITLSSVAILSFLVLGSSSVLAADPITARSSADLTLTADDEGEDGGVVVDPGGEGEVELPDPGEDGEGGIVNPGQKIPLRISLLTAFNFGEIKMSGNTKEYFAELPQVTLKDKTKVERPNFVQVTDNRGTNAGWHLTAKIAEQFKNEDSVLTGSTITLDNGWATPQAADLIEFIPEVKKPVVLTEDDSQLIASAPVDKGMGTWNVLYGTLNEGEQATKGNARESVTLEIPGKVKKQAGSYKAKVEWTLEDTPSK